MRSGNYDEHFFKIRFLMVYHETKHENKIYIIKVIERISSASTNLNSSWGGGVICKAATGRYWFSL